MTTGGLTAFKAGLLQKLFSQKLRFRRDDGTDFSGWTEIRLGDYLVPHRERVPADTEVPIFSSSREGLKPQKEYFADREVENFGEYGIVPKGYITYRHMSDDLTFKFNLNTFGHPIAVSKEYPVFATSDMDPRFLVYWLNHSREFGEFAVMQKKGGTRTRLHFNVLSELRFEAPHPDEQRKIADALAAVDEKIAALSRKIGVLEKFRGGGNA
ncbi:MAG TPA: restriction endonuclease subunit S [Hyphomonas sp.]|nr:restriction endonuclease subunit S [Hyphomonas sp.]